jgi:hypothetical protein
VSDLPLGFDPEALLKDEIVIDKLDAACRQLESAITMFFEEWDVVSQHTLISAAYGILYDLGKQRGVGGSIKDSPLVRPEDRAAFISAIHLPQNFFKHARQDSGTKLAFRYRVSHFFLFDAIRLFVLLHGSATDRMKVFLLWFQLRYPDLLCFKSADDDLNKIRDGVTDPELFKTIGRQLLRDMPSRRREA